MLFDVVNLDRPEPAVRISDLDRLVEAWLQDCALRSPDSSRTVENYRDKVRYFCQWWADVGPAKEWLLRECDLLDFERHLHAVVSKRTGKPIGYHTRNDALRRLRQMFLWANRKKFMGDYSAWVPPVDGEPPQRPAPTAAHIARLFAATEYSAWPERDAAILAVLAGAGARRTECAGLQIQDVAMDADGSGTAIVRLGKRTRRTAKRRRRSRVVAFDAAAGGYIRALIDEMGHADGPLFQSINRPGQSLTPQGVYKVVIGIVEDAGLRSVLQDPCHDLRRAFVTHWERVHRGSGPAVRHLLQRQVGHHSDTMTELYSRPEIEDVREVIVSPVPPR